MNLVDAYVTEVIGNPKQYDFSDKHWFVEVVYDAWGSESKTEIMTNSLEEAEAIKVGHKFLT